MGISLRISTGPLSGIALACIEFVWYSEVGGGIEHDSGQMTATKAWNEHGMRNLEHRWIRAADQPARKCM